MTAASDWLILTEPVETPQLQNRYLNSVLMAQQFDGFDARQ
jgi:hypothetical protein